MTGLCSQIFHTSKGLFNHSFIKQHFRLAWVCFGFFLFKSVHIFVQNVTIVCAGYFPQRWKTVSGMETTSKAQ